MADQTSSLGHYCLTDGELPYFLRCAEGKDRQINGCCSGGAAVEQRSGLLRLYPILLRRGSSNNLTLNSGSKIPNEPRWVIWAACMFSTAWLI